MTPSDLLRAGLYKPIAVPWYPHDPHKQVSCALVWKQLDAVGAVQQSHARRRRGQRLSLTLSARAEGSSIDKSAAKLDEPSSAGGALRKTRRSLLKSFRSSWGLDRGSTAQAASAAEAASETASAI